MEGVRPGTQWRRPVVGVILATAALTAMGGWRIWRGGLGGRDVPSCTIRVSAYSWLNICKDKIWREGRRENTGKFAPPLIIFFSQRSERPECSGADPRDCVHAEDPVSARNRAARSNTLNRSTEASMDSQSTNSAAAFNRVPLHIPGGSSVQWWVGLLLVFLMGLALAGCDSAGPPDEQGNTPGLPEPPVQSFPRWSPDGDRILYYDHGLVRYDPETNRSEHDRNRKGLWTMRPDGTDRRQVLAGASLYGDWSPGGDSLVFERGGQIYKAALEDRVVDTASIVRLTPSGRYFDPDWSPSGKRVAYRNSIGDTTGVWLSPTDGSQSREYFTKGGTPQWFPNSQRLLYTRNGALFVETTDHSSRTQIYSLPDSDDPHSIHGISISPNGDRIAASLPFQVWTMAADGTNKNQLTEKGAGQEPDWSPNGERIVYVGPEHTIWVMDADGSDKQQLTTRPEGAVGQGESS